MPYPIPNWLLLSGTAEAAGVYSEKATPAGAPLRTSFPYSTRLEAVRPPLPQFCKPSCTQFTPSPSRHNLPLRKSRDIVGSREVRLGLENPDLTQSLFQGGFNGRNEGTGKQIMATC